MAWIKKRTTSTGVLNATSLLEHLTLAAFNVNALRVGDSVELSCYVRQFDVAGVAQGGTLMTLPVGWRPAMPYRVATVQPSAAVLDVSATGAVTVVTGSIAQGTYVTFRLAHLTRDAWPAGGAL